MEPMRSWALVALAAVSNFLAAPLVAPSCTQLQAMACCSSGADECAGMTSVEACCRPAPVQGENRDVLAPTTAPDPSSRNRALALGGGPAGPSLVETGVLVVTAAGVTLASRLDQPPTSLAILRI
jgi:hypothetical protein